MPIVVLFWRVLHPERLTWNLKMMVWKMIFLSNWVVFRLHVNLPGFGLEVPAFLTNGIY